MPRSLPGPVMILPWVETSPVEGSSKPAMMRNSVDLPQPEAPIRQTSSPLSMARSMRASASISPSPTGKRLVTPRTVSRSRRPSRMMLRAPAQHAVADHHDDPVGDEAAHADHDHAGHHEVRARKRASIHDHRAEPGRNAGHLADHDQDPGEPMRDAQPAEDRRQRGREHDLAEHRRAGAA